MEFKLTPIKQAAIFLSIYAALAISFNLRAEVFIHLGSTVGFGLLVYLFFRLISGKKKLLTNTLITTLIIFLVLHPYTSPNEIYIAFLTTLIALIIKFFLEHKGKPFINPTVLALLITFGITEIFTSQSVFISWWGAAFKGYLTLGLIGIWIIFGATRFRKIPTILFFLLAHLALKAILQTPLSSIEFIFTDATIYFLASIMLIEPKTSPIKSTQQIIYGVFAAIALNALLHYNVPHAEILCIAAANLLFFATKNIKLSSKEPQKS